MVQVGRNDSKIDLRTFHSNFSSADSDRPTCHNQTKMVKLNIDQILFLVDGGPFNLSLSLCCCV
jgi:hypothetical protein